MTAIYPITDTPWRIDGTDAAANLYYGNIVLARDKNLLEVRELKCAVMEVIGAVREEERKRGE